MTNTNLTAEEHKILREIEDTLKAVRADIHKVRMSRDAGEDDTHYEISECATYLEDVVKKLNRI